MFMSVCPAVSTRGCSHDEIEELHDDCVSVNPASGVDLHTRSLAIPLFSQDLPQCLGLCSAIQYSEIHLLCSRHLATGSSSGAARM